MNDAERAELDALRVRASIAEAARQAAEARGDRQAVREHELELSRLNARHCDLARKNNG